MSFKGIQSQSSWWVKLLAWFGSTRFGSWTIINLGTNVDRWLIRATGGRMNTTIAWPCLLLTTKGARSGKPRTIPLVYVEDGGNIVLIASKGGNLHHPAWYHNLRKNPEAKAFLNGRSASYIASEAEGEEHQRLWIKAVELYSGYQKYQRRAGERKIPVIVVKPK